MTALLKLACGLALVVAVVAPPPRAQPPPPHQPTEEELNMTSETMGLEYKNYLEEVVKMLEQDAQFKDILANATDEDIQSGSVADKLHVVDPSIRSKLDELKRIELDRLRRKATEAFELSNGLDRNTIREPHHLDHRNPHTFREEDLRKLIHKTTKDLEELDRQRREDFKRYEMEKEFKYQEQLKTLDEEHKKEAVKKHEEELKKKKEHPKVHHPLSEDQLEEVWEEQDHMEREDFNPETFFRMHDVDGNELLDQNEVMALFKTELDKIYNGTDYDPRERDEEMNEMRESTYAEVDTDRDGFISLKEFLASTQHEDYRADQGWEGVNEREMFARQEYEKYEQQRHAEIQRQINMGVPHAAGQPVPVQGQQQLPAGQQQQQQLPNQNQQFQQPPQQQFQQPPQQQFQQPPQQQFQQPPQQQQQFQQPPQQQFQQSPQQQQYQQPPQQQFQQPPQQPQQQQYQQPPQQQQQQQQYQQQPPQQQQQQYQQPPQQQQQQQQQVPAQKQQQQTGTVNQVPVQTKQ
ncbi:nucleobindin-2-like isoform X4 [Amphibalanus amphitrite]|uniref:nucleobindin-2-like isoform X4 n=1 Tax=Amphibalanus amphitrite TaxID=1232801 RepID=UPI001C906213|nr:nucleobindin-2-like isoform X4 [Amphibalanus amphitrite]